VRKIKFFEKGMTSNAWMIAGQRVNYTRTKEKV